MTEVSDMADTTGSVIVIGGSVSGYTTVSQLRQHGFDGEVTLIDPEGVPYDRPPLSKGLLTGESTDDEIALASGSWFSDQHVRLERDRAARLLLDEPGETHSVMLDTGAEITGSTIVLATGAEPVQVGMMHHDAESSPNDYPAVFTVRHLDDVRRLHQFIATTGESSQRPVSVAVIGAGLLGAELTSSLRQLDTEVTLFAAAENPAADYFGHTIAQRLHAQHTDHGVRLISERAAELRPSTPARPGAPAETIDVVTATDERVTVDAVVCAVGVSPNTGLAEQAGLEVADGIVVDEQQRTSHPDVFAVGDVSRLRTAARRTEHWQHAVNTATTSATVIAEGSTPHPPPEWFWSDRYDVHVEAVGSLLPAALEQPGRGYRVIHREDASRPDQLATFVLDDDGALVGAASVNDPMAVRAARRIIQRGIRVDPAQLADPAVPVKSLARNRSV